MPTGDDIAETIALWRRAGLTLRESWFALTGELREPADDTAIYRFMAAWTMQQLELPLGEGNTMARMRTVHPGQWTTEDFVACSMAARLLLLGLRNEADDQGVFEWRPRSLKMRILPSDEVDIDELLDELVEHRQIARFSAGGRHYGLCLEWGQKTRRPSIVHPAPPPELRAPPTTPEPAAEIPDIVGNEPDIVAPPPDNVRPYRNPYSYSYSKNTEREEDSESLPPRARGEAPRQSLSSKRSREENAEFERWWCHYPVRRGKSAARDAYRRARRAGATAAELIAGIDRYLAAKPDYAELLYPANWLRQGRWEDEATGAVAVTKGGEGSDPAQAERARRSTWGRPPEWWRQFDPSQRTRVERWVATGKWNSPTPPPGAAGCNLDAELVQAAVAERARLLARQPAMLLPIGGAETAAAIEDAPAESAKPQRAAG